MWFAKNAIGRPAAFAPSEARTGVEASLVRRLDLFLLSFGCLSLSIRSLDQVNINSAYVSGMKEDLHLDHNELNIFATYYTIAYSIMLIPSQCIITHVRPSYWLPALELGWGIVTVLHAVVRTAPHVYALRFFLGLMEASAWPGMITVFMFWYTPGEMAKRMGFYQSFYPIGLMLSGAIQVGILDSMSGRMGVAGWRWLFIINGIMTISFAIAGFFMLPDYPQSPNPRAIWMDKSHARTACDRLHRHGRADSRPVTWTSMKRSLRHWLTYLVSVILIGSILASYGYNYFGLFLKSLKTAQGKPRWTTGQVNAIPIGSFATQVASVWLWSVLADVFRAQWVFIAAQAIIGVVYSTMMSVWTSHPRTGVMSGPGAAYAGYFMSNMTMGVAPLLMAWLSDMWPQEPESRALTAGFALAGLYAITAWYQVLVWPAMEAPYYRCAWQVSLAMWLLVLALTFLLRYLHVRHLRPKQQLALEADHSGTDATESSAEAAKPRVDVIAVTVDAKE